MNRHLIISVSILVLSVTTTMAQYIPTQPTIIVRESLVAALNDAIGNEEENFSFANSGLYLLNIVDNACEVINPLEIEFEYPSGADYFVMRRKMSDGGLLSGAISHELVEDLNNWLNTVWAMDITNLSGLEWECDNPGQRYYTQVTTDADVVETFQILSGEQAMLDKYYTINGNSYKGSDILRFVPPSTTRDIRYIADLGADPDDASDNHRLLSEAYLEILCPDTVTGIPESVFTFRFLVQTYSYGTGDCSNFKSTPNRIEIAVDGLVKCLEGGKYLVGTPEENNEALWNGYLGTAGMWNFASGPDSTVYPGVPELGVFSINESGNLDFRFYYGEFCFYYYYNLCKLVERAYDDEYCTIAICKGGEFGLDPDSKALIYTLSDPEGCGGCTSHPIPCILFCDEAVPELPEITNVIRADARTFSDRTSLIDAGIFPLFDFSTIDVPLSRNPGLIAYSNKNTFESGYRGKWRVVDEHLYRSSIVPGTALFSNSASTERNYNDAGVFDLTLFEWDRPQLNDPTAWLNTTTIVRYSQNGEPVEEEDIFGIPSAARFGYAQQLPVLVAKNARFDAVSFLSFEDGTRTLEAGEGPIVEETAHSGRYSFAVPSANWSEPILFYYTLGPTQLLEKVLIRFWVRQTYDPGAGQDEGECPVSLQFIEDGTPLVDISYPDIRFIAKTGAWSLYETILDNTTVSLLSPDDYHLRVKNLIPEVDVWLDDFRIQPYRSEMVCYAYDPDNLRQVALFDDQHFGVFYQYNAEGQLVRRIRETERGLKTVQETQYHTPLVVRGGAPSSSIIMQPDSYSGSMPLMADGDNQEWNSSVHGKRPDADLLSLDLGFDRRDLKIFGMEAGELGDKINDLKSLADHPSIKGIELPVAEKLSMLEELARLDADLDDLAQLEARGDMSQAARAALRSSVQEATRRRSEIMSRLGISESDARNLVKTMREIKADSQSNGGRDDSGNE